MVDMLMEVFQNVCSLNLENTCNIKNFGSVKCSKSENNDKTS